MEDLPTLGVPLSPPSPGKGPRGPKGCSLWSIGLSGALGTLVWFYGSVSVSVPVLVSG